MPRKVVIFATVGHTDLQVVVERDGEQYRAVIGRNRRGFHEWVLEQKDSEPIVVNEFYAGVSSEDQGKGIFLDWSAHRTGFDPNSRFKPMTSEERIVLTPPKLAAVAESLKKDPDMEVIAAVVFNTRRSPSDEDPAEFRSACDGEPIASGPILAKWLGGFLGLPELGTKSWDIGAGKAGWVDILDGKMMQEGSGRDVIVNREAVARIDRAASQAASWGTNRDVWACVSVGGGMT